MYVTKQNEGISGLGMDPVTATLLTTAIMAGVQKIFSKFFGKSGNPDWTGINFDPDDRKPKRLYDMPSAEANAEVINKLQKPIWTSFGITQSDVHQQLWDPWFQIFVRGGGTWRCNTTEFTTVIANFLSWLTTKGKQPDPRPIFAALESFGAKYEARWGSGRNTRKEYASMSQVSQILYDQIVGSIPGAFSGSGAGEEPVNAGFDLSSLLGGINPLYLVLGGLGLLLIVMAPKRSQQPQIMLMPQ